MKTTTAKNDSQTSQIRQEVNDEDTNDTEQ